MHKVHRPDLINSLRHRQDFWLLAYKPFTRLDPQIELQFLVDSIHTLVVPFKPFDITQIQVAKAKAPVAMVICYPNQPSGHLIVLSIELTLVAVARLADAKRHTGNPYANASICDHLLGHLPLLRDGLTTFFREPPTRSQL